jgi:hypothetical protein
MKFFNFPWLAWITRIWGGSTAAPPPRAESPHERIDRLFPKHHPKKPDEETVILLGDRSREFDPPESK